MGDDARSARLEALTTMTSEVGPTTGHGSSGDPGDTWRTALFDALRDGVFVLDRDGTVLDVNDAFETILGYGREGLPYSTPLPWWPDPATDPRAHSDVVDAYSRMLGLGSGEWVVPLRHRDGHLVWTECSTAIVADSADHSDPAPLVVGVMRDVTARERSARWDRLLAEAGWALTQPGDPDERLQDFVDCVAAAAGELVLILRAGPDGRLAPAAAAHPDRPEVIDEVLALGPYPISASVRENYRTGLPFLIDPVDHQRLDDPAGLAVLRRLDARTMLLVPLVASGRLLGVMVSVSADPLRFTRVHIPTVTELGRRAAGAIEANRVAVRERQLYAASTALAAATTVGNAAAVLARAIRTTLGASAVAVFTIRAEAPNRLSMEHSLGLAPAISERFGSVELDEDFAVCEAVLTREPVWLGTDSRRVERFPHLAQLEGLRHHKAALSAPLCLGDNVLGAVSATFPTRREFPADERAFALTLIAQASQAFERAALTDTRWRIAQNLQRSLLPGGLPQLPRLALAAHYQPAGGKTQAGGDWYDIFAIDDTHVGIVIGDVVGAGPAAAGIGGQLRSALTGFLLAGHDPAHALDLLDRLADRIEGAITSTATCMVLNTRNGELSWARAGHPPPLLIEPGTGDDRARFLNDGHGPALGIIHRFDPHRTQRPRLRHSSGGALLTPGSSVLLYTDGLVERRGEMIDDGFERLAAAAAPHSDAEPAALLEAALAGALADTGVHDDVALVVIRLLAAEPGESLPPPLDQQLLAVPEELRGVRRAVRAWSTVAGVTEDTLTDLQLALNEAIGNSIEHAYPAGPPGAVGYRVEIDPEGDLHVEVRDHGTWRPPRASEIHRGRGLAVMQNLAREFTLRTSPAGTYLRFTLSGV